MSGCCRSPAAVAALFVCRSSPYWRMPGVECFDLARDARAYRGDSPVVAHPPCRAWGRLRHFAKPRDGERELALFAVAQARRVGGVVEHPAASKLWELLPKPGLRDEFGGFVLPIHQSWFGHRAPKATALYVCGLAPRDLPRFPILLGMPAGRVENMCTAERERTPVELARWLVDLASRCSAPVPLAVAA